MSIFHRAGTVLEFRAESLGEEGSGVRRVRALRGSPPPGKSATQLRRRPPPGARSRSRGSRLTASRVRRAPPARPRPPGGVGRRRPRRRRRRRPSPAPGGGVELVMSPRLALCEAGWRESSRGGFRRAGLARCEAGWTVSRWARITQARPGPGPVIPLSGPGITQARPGPRRSGAGVRLRRSGSRGGRRARTQDVLAPARGRSGCRARHRGPDPDPRPGSSRPGPRDRHLTREHVPLADVLAGQVTISAVTRRSRGLSDVLAARAVPRRGGQVSWRGVLPARW